jgi:hypothetical protein
MAARMVARFTGPLLVRLAAVSSRKARTGNQPAACAATRNLAIGAARKAGFANIARARRYYARDDQRILALYGYMPAYPLVRKAGYG